MEDEDATRKEEIKKYFSSLGIIISDSFLASLFEHLATQNIDITQESCTRSFLASSITHSLSPTSPHFPPLDGASSDGGGGAGTVHNVCVQVLACIEVGSSLTSLRTQLDDYQERQKPLHRRLVSLPSTDQDYEQERDGEGSGKKNAFVEKKMVKVTLQDVRGREMYAIDVVSVKELYLGMTLGAKLLLLHVPILHGVLMLKPDRVQWLGGHLEALNSPSTGLLSEPSTAPGRSKVVLERLKQDLETRLRQFPIMNSRDRQRAVANQLQQEQEEEGGIDPDGEGNDDQSVQNSTRGRGRGRGTRGSRGRVRARASRARGR